MTSTGKKSPRWAFMARLHVVKEGESYLRRLRLVETPWGGVYIHHLDSVDKDYDPHDHPWSFWSLVLWGGYIENVYPHKAVRSGRRTVWRNRWSLHRMGREAAHRIIRVKPRTVTLVVHGRRHPEWGFWTPNGYVPSEEYAA